MFQSVSGIYRSIGGVTGTPGGKIWAIWAIGGEHTSLQGVPPPPRKEAKWEKGKRGFAPPFLLSFLFPFPPLTIMEGGEAELGKTPSRIRPTWDAASLPLLPSHLYIYVGGGGLEHTTSIVSRVRHPLHSLHPRSYSRGA